MKSNLWIVLSLLLVVSLSSYAQQNSLSIGTTQINNKAVLWLVPNASGQGLLLPVVSGAVRNGMGLQAADRGMMVYDSNDNSVYLWNGNAWNNLASGGSVTFTGANGITITGNTISTDAIRPTMNATGDLSGTFANPQIANNAVTTAKIANDAVDNSKIANVNPSKLTQAAATTGQVLKWSGTAWAPADDLSAALTAGAGITIASNVISNTGILTTSTAAGDVTGTFANLQIANNAITDVKLADNAVTTAKIANNAVIASKIADGNVTTTKIADNAISTAKVQDGNITTAKIADGAVTDAKLGSGIAVNKLAPGTNGQVLTVSGGQASWQPAPTSSVPILSNGQILTGNGTINTPTALSGDATLAGGALTIANNAVTTPKIANDAVTTPKILDANVTSNKIANDAVTTAKILDANVTTNKIANNAVTNAKLANNAVDASKIADGTITGADLAGNLVVNTTGGITAASFTGSGAGLTGLTAAQIPNLDAAKITTGAFPLSRIAPSGTNGDVLTTVGGVPVWQAPITGATTLDGLSDVTAAGATDAQILIKNGVGDFTNRSLSGDVSITNAGATTIANNAITTAKLANNSIDASKITDGSITGADLAGNIAITTTGNVTAANFTGNGSGLTGVTAADGSITGGTPGAGVKIAASTITDANIAAGANIAASKLAGTVVLDTEAPNAAGDITGNFSTGLQIGAGTIGNNEVVSGIDAAKISVGTLPAGVLPANVLLNSSAAGGELSGTLAALTINNNAVTTAKILDANVTNTKLATDAVDGSKILDGAITETDLDPNIAIATSGNITAANFIGNGSGLTGISATVADGSITGGTPGAGVKIAASTITDANIAAGANIAASKLAGTVVLDTEAPNAAGDITGNFSTGLQIGAGTIGNNEVVSGIDAAKISVGTLPAGVLPANVLLNSSAAGGELSGTLAALTINNNAVTTAKIFDANVTNAKLATGIDAAKITVGTLPTARLDVGTAANQIVQLDGSGRLPAVDGSQLTGLAGGGDITGVTAGTGLTGGAASGDAILNVNVGTGANQIPQLDGSGKLNVSTIPTGVNANQIVQLDGSGRLPAVDGSQLTGLAATVADGSITGGTPGAGVKIAASTITDANIAAGANIAASKLAGTVVLDTEAPNAAGDITGNFSTGLQIGAGTIGNNEVVSGIDAAKISTGTLPGAVLPANVLLNSSTAGGELSGTLAALTINNNAVTTAKILDANVTNTKLANNAVDASKIADGSITGADLAGTIAISTTGNITAANFIGTGAGLTALNANNFSSGTLPVARGGTNLTAVTPGGIAFGSATDFAFTPAGTAGQILQSNGAAAPTWVNAPATATASNGLTKTGDDFVLGGTLTGTTTIANGGFDLAITGAGRLGIGTATPNEALEVNGKIRLNGNHLYSSTSNLWVGIASNSVVSGLGNFSFGGGTGITTGNYNIILGNNAGQLLQTGSENILMSANAGGALVSGSANVFIGSNAGGMGTGNNNVAIGAGASVSASVNGSAALGTGANATVSNTIVLGGTQNVGIGTSTPSERLDVSGNVRFSGALMPNNTAGTSGQVLTSAGAGFPPTWTTIGGGGNMVAANNLSELTNVATARTNLGLGSLATLSSVASAQITDGTITGADLAGNIVVNTTGAITAASFTGDGSGLTGITASVADGSITGGTPGAGVKIAASTITDANIAAGANIAASKLAGTVVLDTEAPNAAGDITGNFSTGLQIGAGTIGNNEVVSGIDAAKISVGTLPAGVLPANVLLNSSAAGGELSGTLGALSINNNAVTTAKILDANVTNAKLATGIDAAKITVGTLPTARLDVGTAANQIVQLDGSGRLPAVDGSQLTGLAATVADGSITGGTPGAGVKIAASTITDANIAAGANIAASKLAGTVVLDTEAPNAAGDITGNFSTGLQIGAGTIGNNEVVSGIDAAKISTGTLPGAVLPANVLLNSSAAGGELSGTLAALTINNNAVTTTKILDANVTNAKLANNAVDATKIADGSITGADLASNITITTSGSINANGGFSANNVQSDVGLFTGQLAVLGVSGSPNFTLTNNISSSYEMTIDDISGILSIARDGSNTFQIGNGLLFNGGPLWANGNPGSNGQVLTSTGSTTPPIWSNGVGWGLTGNTLTGTERIGSDNLQPLIFETNNTDRMTISSTGRIGIGAGPASDTRVMISENSNTYGLQSINGSLTSGPTFGIFASAGASSTENTGIRGEGFGAFNIGVRGVSNNSGTSGYGVRGDSFGNGLGYGVYGTATGTGAQNYALFGTASGGTTNWAGFFASGNVHITNALSVGATPGTFGTLGQVLTSNGPGAPPTWSSASAVSPANTVVRGNAAGSAQQASQITDNGSFVGIGTPAVNRLDVEGALAVGTGYSGSSIAPSDGAIIQGNVGIGTASVANRLDVEGGLAVGSNYSGTSAAPGNGAIIEGSVGIGTTTTANKVDVEGNLAIGATYSGTSVAPINGAIIEGLVGVGTPSPGANLHVRQNVIGGAVTGIFENTNAGDASVRFTSNTSNNYMMGVKNSDGSFTISNSATSLGVSDRLVISSAGNVGIGTTTTPTQRLEVVGSMRASGNVFVDATGVNTGDTNNALRFGDVSTNPGEGIGSKRTPGGNANGLDFYTGYLNRMAITNGGNVGIGTSSPTERLDVNGNVNITSAGVLNFGNVGVLNTGGDANNITANIRTIRNTATGGTGDGLYIGLGNSGGNAGHLRFYTNGAQRMHMDANNGFIGINTTSPIYPLDVAGNAPYTTAFGPFDWAATSSGSGVIGGGNNFNISIRAVNGILANAYLATSDERIKRKIGVSNSRNDLATLMKLRITDYKYTDSLYSGNVPVKGVFAQELEKVYPDAVSKQTNWIPNIYAMANSVVYDEASHKLSITLTKPHGLVVGDKVKLILNTGGEKPAVVSAATDSTFTVADWTEKSEKVFVFGKEVNDFRIVDYDRLFTLNISATQELVKMIEDQKKVIDELKAKEEESKKKITALEASLNKAASSASELATLKSEVEKIKAALGMSVQATVKKEK